MSIVCLDTQIIIWGIKEEASPSQEHLIPQAKNFIEWLDENDKKVIIPVPIISELLAPIPDSKYEELLGLLNSRFRVVPVDEVAAIKCAQIWRDRKDDKELREYRKQNKITRERMKFDFQIAAVAIVRKAECIYSNDPHIKKFVGDIITVKEMPNIGSQGELEL